MCFSILRMVYLKLGNRHFGLWKCTLNARSCLMLLTADHLWFSLTCVHSWNHDANRNGNVPPALISKISVRKYSSTSSSSGLRGRRRRRSGRAGPRWRARRARGSSPAWACTGAAAAAAEAVARASPGAQMAFAFRSRQWINESYLEPSWKERIHPHL